MVAGVVVFVFHAPNLSHGPAVSSLGAQVRNRGYHRGVSTESEKPDPDRFQGVLDGPEIETKVKGSRFRAQVFGVDSEVQAKERLLALRKQYHDATHHCTATRLGPPDAPLERGDLSAHLVR